MTTGLRERKKLRTRQALGEATLRLAVQRGLADVTVDEIAEAADVAPRTFFNHFSSKEEAVVAGDAERAQRLCDELAARPAGEDVLTAARVVLTDAVAHFSDPAADADARSWTEQLRLVRRTPSLVPHQLAAHAEVEHRLAAVIAARTGLDATDLYPATVAAAVMAAARVSIDAWLRDGTTPLGELLDRTLGLLADGLSPPPAPALPRPRSTTGDEERTP
jgi:AcrR family transcriptional regulator